MSVSDHKEVRDQSEAAYADWKSGKKRRLTGAVGKGAAGRGQKRWVKNTLRKYDILRRGWSGRGAKGRPASSSPR